MKEGFDRYKALVFDLDGTAIPNKPEGMPSETLVSVVGQLQKKIKVSAATGRPLFNSRPIIQKLGLKDPCIISGGTQIINPKTEEILWERDMDQSQVEQIMEIVRTYNYPVFFGDDETSTPAHEKAVTGSERIIYVEPVTAQDTPDIMAKLAKIADITAHEVKSWTAGHFDIHITHSQATKSQAMKVLLGLLNVRSLQVFVVGDSNNDLPLFEQAGYKVAMANGSDDLKRKADLIAPNVSEDGLAKVLKDFFDL